MRPRPAMLRAIAALTATVLLAAGLAGCADPFHADGDDLAQRAAAQIADDIGAHSDNTCEITLLEMVAHWVPEDTAEPLAWEGAICDGGARIDVRIHVDVDAASSGTLFGRSQSAGEATRCFRLEWDRYDPARRSDIPCPDGPAPARPTPAPRPEFTAEDRSAVASIVSSTAELADIEAALREAYPQEHIRLDTQVFEGEIVVALGMPAERECILVVRNATGEVFFPDFRRISLEPGETGCATDLYTNPPF
ncbi:hypothetical protein [Microbacterium sp. HJ5]